MRYTMFGRSGLRVSDLALGTMTFGDDWGWGAGKAACAEIFDRFAAAGGNFVDTASNYTGGSAERILGELLGKERDRFVLATKYTLEGDPQDVNSAGNSRRNLLTSIEASLRRLRTDRIDLLWVHARDSLTPVEEVMRALDDQVRAGKVVYVGVSDWPAWEIAHANTLADLRGWSPFVGLQTQYNLLERTSERELLPMAHAFDLAVTAWSPLAAGRLTGKYLPDAGPDDTARLHTMGAGTLDPAQERVVREVVAVAEEGGWSPSQVSLAWLRARPGNIVPIIGTTKLSQLDDNLSSLDVVLDGEQLDRLNRASAIDAGFPYGFLRGESAKQLVYGSRWAEVDDRRSTARRTPADDIY